MDSGEGDVFSKALEGVRILHERRIQELESIIASLYVKLSGKGLDIRSLMKQLAELGVRHRQDMTEQADLVDDMVSFFRAEATRAILNARLKMAKEASDPSFDMSLWDTSGWKRTLNTLK